MIKIVPKYNLIFGRNVNFNLVKPAQDLMRKNHDIIGQEIIKDQKKKITEFPEEPTTCCTSGCPNCVWLNYAEKLSAHFQDGGEKAIQEISEKVQDSNVRAFLLHELRMRNKNKT